MNRKDIAQQDTWDLSSLFKSDESWYSTLTEYEKMAEKIPSFQGTLGQSAESLARYLAFFRDLMLVTERLGYYSELRQAEDEGDSEARSMSGRYIIVTAKIQASLAWATPEIQAIPDTVITEFLNNPLLKEYTVYLKKILRTKPYVLSAAEEKLLSLYAETDQSLSEIFTVLTNVDLDFGSIDTPEGPKPLSQSTFSLFMESPDRIIREKAYKQFYQYFDSHKTTLATVYSSQVKQDVVLARIRGFSSARAVALFPDNVPESVYDNLIETIHANLQPLHRYYALKKRILNVSPLRHYDVYAPLVPTVSRKTQWDEAVKLIESALAPLGKEYTTILTSGLRGRWADRYENKGKRSGAFSAGSFSADPYILMNYKEDSIRDVFTLAHEGGHSMHSYYAARSNPFLHYNYTIFEAEVASTLNEELVFRYLLKEQADTVPLAAAYLSNKRADDIVATLYRQTMFAEFEKYTHTLEENGTPLTIDILRTAYKKLLEQYFGPSLEFESESDLECLRIPHFYRAFYVYKYATGISAALALTERIVQGGARERDDYLRFLRSGGSQFPLESLHCAGVDMASPQAIQAACHVFERLVTYLESTLY
ncbi:MAG: oligoendopeptidase F [Treponema sp.]|jgi:oligoendopeptidase F|nr:oligoendopeptidase F [Treponema sp.]